MCGRERKGERIDHSVGLIGHHKVGDWVRKDAPLCTIHANDEEKLALARERILAAYTFGDEPVQPLPLFHRRIVASE